MRLLRTLAGVVLAVLLVLWRLTCRYRVEGDPRPSLRVRGKPYVYALLHAHQAAAVFVNDERRLAAMVSRSADGDLLVPALRVRGVQAVRGSTRKGERDKGGRAALQRLRELVVAQVPALLAVDGPRGPRNHVHRGVAELALETGAAILPTVVVPSRRLILTRTWDRLQLPLPFALIRLIFAEPIEPRPGEDVAGLRQRIADALGALERREDPKEAQRQRLEDSQGQSAAL